jgi:hypothetical protein
VGRRKGLSRDLLIRFIAWRLEATRVQLEDLANGDAPPRTTSPKPGTTLLRKWNGTTHTVQVLEDGFEYRGQRFPSLTKAAAAISGLHRSGPAFFGLNRPLRRFSEQGPGVHPAGGGL